MKCYQICVNDLRQQYQLKLRENQRLQMLRQEIADEEFLFSGENLTEREKRDLNGKK